MGKQKAGERLSEYNSIMKETDEIYREAAKAIGLSDCAFWILYVLREDCGAVTQSQICRTLYQAKQTVNSALKKMQQSGYIELCSSGDRRSKARRAASGDDNVILSVNRDLPGRFGICQAHDFILQN